MPAVRGSPGRTSGTSCSAAPTSSSHMCSGTPPAVEHLSLAPAANPARDALVLQLNAAEPGDVRVTLFDVSGRVRAERTLVGPARARTVRFDGLPAGLYFARASQAGSSTLARI